MAAIGRIRQRSGLLIIIVGVALAAFVLGDLLKNVGNGKMKYDPTVVGFINGEKISTNDFTIKVDESVDNFMRNQNKTTISSEERYNVQLQVWAQVESETVLHQQAEALGLIQDNGNDPKPSISMDEYADLLTGTKPHPYIVQNFRNQTTGNFDPSQVTRFLNSIEAGKNSQNPSDQEQALKSEKEWVMLEKYIKEDRLSTKYFNLISKAYFVPKTIAKAIYAEKNNSRSVRFVNVSYGLINDSSIVPTDANYQAYYDEHKNEFKSKEEARKVDYVAWNVRASESDIKDIEKNVSEIYQDLTKLDLKEIPGYVNRNSNNPYDSSWFKKGSLSPFIDSLAFGSAVGGILSPWQENNEYHMARILDMQMRPDSMRASHILISFAGAQNANEKITRTKIGASSLADSLLASLKANPMQFEAMASNLSDDPSKSKQGDLGWFADGAMVAAFNKVCVEGNVGDFKKVETPFGYHIVKVTGKKTPVKKVRIAIINIPIIFSQKTYELAFNEASQFVSRARNAASFDSVSVNMALNVSHSNDLDKMANGIMGISDSRKIIQWLFDEKRELNEVSDVFDFSNVVVVALYNELTPKGIRPLDEKLKEFIKVLVIRDLKAEKLMKQYASLKDLNSIAIKAKSKIDTMDFLTFGTYSLQNYGPEPNVQGTMFSSKLQTLVGPIKGDQGIYFFIIDKETIAPVQKGSYEFVSQQEKSLFDQRLRKDYNNSNDALKSLIDISKIKDFRQYYY